PTARLLAGGSAHDVDLAPRRTELLRDAPRHPLAGALPCRRVDDRERSGVPEGRLVAHAPAGARALRIASCSSSESWCRERPASTCLAKIRVFARLCRLESTTPFPSASRRAIANDWSPPVSANGLKRTTPTFWMLRWVSSASSRWGLLSAST